ncbi:MAG: hypothetical protein EOP21_09345 [Hyphomicrobiales bacterium]|nr:MAG: hypothetical protein EOP21_09345 [Hyphomicrobiales bacterium]
MGEHPGKEKNFSFDPDQFPPAKIAPFVVWLCTNAASNVNGRTFQLRGDDVTLLAEPAAHRTIYQRGGWDLDGLDAAASSGLTGGLNNAFTLDAYPDLKTFRE